MMPSAQVVETSVNVTSNSPSQDYTHSDDHNLPNYDVPFCLVIGIKYEIFRAPFLQDSFNKFANVFQTRKERPAATCNQ